MISNASDSEVRDARAARQSAGSGDFVWFIQDGKTYVSQDKTTVDRIVELHRVIETVDGAQGFLEAELRKMSARQSALSAEFAKVTSLQDIRNFRQTSRDFRVS